MKDKLIPPANNGTGPHVPPASNVTGISQFIRGRLEHPRVIQYLTAHGFTIEDAERMDWSAVAPDAARQKLGLHNSHTDGAEIALMMPCFNINGSRDPHYQRAIIFKPDGTYAKFSPGAKRAVNRVMYVPGMDYFAAPQIILCESLPKAAFVSLRFGIPAIGLNGIDGWSAEDFTSLPPNAEIIFLSDSLKDKSARNIQGSAQRLSALFTKFRFASPPVPPANWPKDDWGIDDAVLHANDHGAYLFRSILESARGVVDAASGEDYLLTTYEELSGRLPAEWIVDGLIQPGELTAIIGAPNCGKSFLVQDLLCSVARGEPNWFGKDINASGLAIHVTLEGKGLGSRMKAYKQAHNIKGTFPYFALEQSINLRDEHETEKLIRSIGNLANKQSLPVTLVAIDTVNRAMGGGDENSSVDMGGLIRAADALRDAFQDAGIILVHHTGKDERKGARGHSSFMGAIGGALLVEDRGGIRTVTITKQRDGTTDTHFSFKLEVLTIGTNAKGVDITSCVIRPAIARPKEDTSDAHIHRLIYWWNLQERAGKPISRKDLRLNKGRILKGLDIKPAPFFDAVQGLINKGLATEIPRAQGGSSIEFTPPKEAKY